MAVLPPKDKLTCPVPERDELEMDPKEKSPNKKARSEQRKRTESISIRFLPEELEQLKGTAYDCAMRPSTFMRQVSLSHRVESVIDKKAILELSKTSADIRRVGGQLKWWLTKNEQLEDAKEEGNSRPKISTIMREISELKARLESIILDF